MEAFIDTELWVYSLKKPDPGKYPDKEVFKQDMQKHFRAQAFFKGLPADLVLYFTTHQLCELYHALRFRGTRLDPDFVKRYIGAIVAAKSNHVVEITEEDARRCIDLSIASTIHVWDFLCIIPIIKKIHVIFTSNKHFTKKNIEDLGVPISNPIGTWDEL